jgi:glycosyltransferase involved in cell wall biosynthesis
MLRQARLNIALVAPADESRPLADDLAAGLAARGHLVRVYSTEGGFARLFRRLRADAPDVVSQHAAHPEAVTLAEGLPVLHTLHSPPGAGLREACLRSRAWFSAPSQFLVREWLAAGLERVQFIAGALADLPRAPAVVRPAALVVDRTGALAALRAGLGIAMPSVQAATRGELARRLAHCAVCLPSSAQTGGFDWLAAQAQLAGCPVVGYARGALAEIVEHGVSGLLVAPGDTQALSAAARRAASLDRHAVRESARARLRIEAMIERYESELRAVARRSVVRLVA